MVRPIALGAVLVLIAGTASAQNFRLVVPKESPRATASQTVGLTTISITYDRPAVNNRKIWGGLVPYDTVWRAGANENTMLEFSSPVKVGGTELPAGRYGVHTIPTPSTWTFILSKESNAWGSFSYEPREDALRLTLTPVAGPYIERLQYTFEDPTQTTVSLMLHWEKLALSVPFEVNTQQVVLDSLSQQLRGLPKFFGAAWGQAGQWALANTKDVDHAAAWADSAVKLAPTFNNLRLKAAVLDRQGDSTGAKALRDQSLVVGTENDINLYGYALLQQKKVDEAIAIFQLNVKNHPTSWNVYDSLGEAYATKGDKAKATSLYKKALSMAPPEQKQRIEGILTGLKS